jgi:hypothetical protein
MPDASAVTRIVRDSSGIYVTVRGATGEQVVYVNEAGLIVPVPVTTTTVQRVETIQPAVESSQTVVTYDQVQKNASRYELLTKKGNKEVYRDNQTGQKVTVKRQNNWAADVALQPKWKLWP